MGIQWHLRLRMAEKGYFQTSDLVPLLAERGISLSREQVFRFVTQPPQRLSMDTLAALCDILGCQPNDLIEIQTVNEQVRKTAGDTTSRCRKPGERSSVGPMACDQNTGHTPGRGAASRPRRGGRRSAGRAAGTVG